VTARLLHWTMAAMVIAMLFIGVIMVVSLADYHLLLSIHEPLGILILVFVVIRFTYRRFHRPPPPPPTLRGLDHLAATASEYLLYFLLLVQPVIGWATVSASGQPTVLYRQLVLPAITPASTTLYTVLLDSHVILAYLLYLIFTAHLCGVLFHTLVVRDKMINRMAFWPIRGATKSSGADDPASSR
jgi:cytochrome b561